MRVKNCYYPSDEEYEFIKTDYGYDIYEKEIKKILEKNDYRPQHLYVTMIIKSPNSAKKEEVTEILNLSNEWSDGTCEYEWESDWCEGQTEVCILGVFTEDFIHNICVQYTHKYRYSGGWFTV